jgi:hypothetical protein
VAPVQRSVAERIQAWVVTGPLGHLWSAVADILVFFTRARLARLRRPSA